MTYTITSESILASVDKEVSRAAAMAHGDDGSPLFDAYRILSRDRDTLEEYMGDAVSAVFLRLFDIATRSGGNGSVTITFDVPDFDGSMEPEVTKELNRFITLMVCSYWLLEKGAGPKSEEFAKRAEAALEKAHVLLKSRKTPKRNNI